MIWNNIKKVDDVDYDHDDESDDDDDDDSTVHVCLDKNGFTLSLHLF